MYKGREKYLQPSDGSGSAESAWHQRIKIGPEYHPFTAEDAREAMRLAREMEIEKTSAYVEIKQKIVDNSNNTSLRKSTAVYFSKTEVDSVIFEKLCQKLKEEGYMLNSHDEFENIVIVTW